MKGLVRIVISFLFLFFFDFLSAVSVCSDMTQGMLPDRAFHNFKASRSDMGFLNLEPNLKNKVCEYPAQLDLYKIVHILQELSSVFFLNTMSWRMARE